MGLANEFQEHQKHEYMEKLMPLFAYIPYLKEKEGKNTQSLYNQDDLSKTSVTFPIYDGTVLAFVKEAQKTGLVTRNYIYVYQKIGSHNQNPKDERLFISGSAFKDIDTIIAIMSKYVLGGMTKGGMWAQAVEEGVWLHCLIKLKELLEVYDHPLA